MVNQPSFMVRVQSENHIQTASTSCLKTGALGRVKKKKAGKKGGDDDE